MQTEGGRWPRSRDGYSAAMELIRRFTPQEYANALESWAWLPGVVDGKVPIMTTAFGDVALHSVDGVWFLDTIDGTLVLRWADQAALQADLNTRETQQDVLMPWLVAAAEAAGLLPGATEILSFKHPQVLGGTTTIENLEVSDFVVSLNLAGQIHHKVKDLPPGTPVTNFSLE